MARFAFRTDSSLQIGTGHLARCLTLASALRARGNDVLFVCGDLEGHGAEIVQRRGFDVALLSRDGAGVGMQYGAWLGTTQDADAGQFVEALRGAPPDWAVVDHYALDRTWHRAVKKALKCRIMVVDDLANRDHACDILLDQNFRFDPTVYTGRVPEGCRIFLGPRYLLLDQTFFDTAPQTRSYDEVRRLFIFFGGVDRTGATLMALEALQSCGIRCERVDVVCGGRNPHLDAIRATCSKQDFTLHIDTSDMANLIAASDAGIGGGGVNMWERCFLGLPTLVLTIAENQEKAAREAVDAGFIRLLGSAETVGKDELAKSVSAFVGDSALRRNIALNCTREFRDSRLDEIFFAML